MGDGDETNPSDEPLAENPNYDQDFFLALAAKGKEAWNAWRRDPANKNVRVTFAGIDISEAQRDGIDFSGFEFGDHADFSGCGWRAADSGEIAGVGNQEDLEAFMRGTAYFRDATFGVWANFTGAAFGDRANFASVLFGSDANFTAAAFGHLASFTGAAFGDRANFAGAAFGERARFYDTVFKGRVEITGINFDKWGAFKALLAVGHPHRGGWSLHGPGPECLLSISFARARFDDGANFSGRSFYDAADFSNARFYSPPDFDAAASAARIDFSGVHIGFVPPGRLLHWTTESTVSVRLRRLRKIAEDTKNHDLERDLYIEERKAERGVYLHQLLGLDELKQNLEAINKQKKACLVRMAAPAQGAQCALARDPRQPRQICAAVGPPPLDRRHVRLLGASRLWPQFRAARRLARCEPAVFLFALSRGPRAAHARCWLSQRGQI
jgi:hypothetical protein